VARMKLIFNILFLLLLLTNINAQISERTKVKLVGRDIIFPVIAYQENCPLKILKFMVVENYNGRYKTEYAIKNVGKKSIKAYRIAQQYNDWSHGFFGYGELPANKALFTPGTIVDTTGNLQIVSDLKASSGSDTLKNIIFMMVVDIEFADGSKYTDETSFNALDDFLKRSQGLDF
jgi:hypothetical protein